MVQFSLVKRISSLRDAIKRSQRAPWIFACSVAVVLAVVLGIPLGWSLRGKELSGEILSYFNGRLVSRRIFCTALYCANLINAHRFVALDFNHAGVRRRFSWDCRLRLVYIQRYVHHKESEFVYHHERPKLSARQRVHGYVSDRSILGFKVS